MKCSRCGMDCSATSIMCSRCGAALSVSTAPTAAPVQPAVQAPVQPQYQAPVQPAAQAPVQPQYQAPVQPQYQAPVQPQYQAPVQPQYQAPVQPEAVAASEEADEGKKKKKSEKKPGKKKLGIIIAAIVAVLVIAIGIGAGSGGSSEEQTTLSAEEAMEANYNTFLGYIADKDFKNAVAVYNRTGIKEYKDADVYFAYAQAEVYYAGGGIGEAYELVKDLTISEAQELKTTLENKLSGLQGVYKEDNGDGSYLWMKIDGGKVYQEIIGYYDEVQTPDFTDSYAYYLVTSKYSTGVEFFGIGRYASTGVNIYYAISTYTDSSDLLVVRFEGNEYTTFNGLYEKQY